MNTILMNSLSKLMEINGINSLELSQATKISANIIFRIKNGTYTNPTINTVKNLANHFGLTVSQFICELLNK